jgi:hypothetical protein
MCAFVAHFSGSQAAHLFGQIIEGPWGKAATANLTPDPSGIPYYDEALFIRAIRTGAVGPRELSRAMPWLVARNMTART